MAMLEQERLPAGVNGAFGEDTSQRGAIGEPEMHAEALTLLEREHDIALHIEFSGREFAADVFKTGIGEKVFWLFAFGAKGGGFVGRREGRLFFGLLERAPPGGGRCGAQ